MYACVSVYAWILKRGQTSEDRCELPICEFRSLEEQRMLMTLSHLSNLCPLSLVVSAYTHPGLINQGFFFFASIYIHLSHDLLSNLLSHLCASLPLSFLATFIGHLLYYSQGTQRRKSSYTKGAPFPLWVEMEKMGFRFIQ